RARDLAGEDPSKHAEEIKRLVTDARVIWPRLPGLENFLRQQERKYPILFVGVRELPQYFSPATAATDTERQAVELLFESLVRPEYTVLQSGQKEQVSCRYGAGLTDGRPRLVALGREFLLPRDAFWSDGKPVTANDVQRTVVLLQ